MDRWSAILGVGMLSAGFLVGCHPDSHWNECPGPECETTQIAAEKLCPLETHVCMPYIGGGWDNVLRWKGDKIGAPTACPAAAAGMAFWGDVTAPGDPGAAEYAVGCGFVEAGTCDGVVANGADDVCAPLVAGWPACVVANSPRQCPPLYDVQTMVGSDDAADMQWTVCCVSDSGRAQ